MLCSCRVQIPKVGGFVHVLSAVEVLTKKTEILSCFPYLGATFCLHTELLQDIVLGALIKCISPQEHMCENMHTQTKLAWAVNISLNLQAQLQH